MHGHPEPLLSEVQVLYKLQNLLYETGLLADRFENATHMQDMQQLLRQGSWHAPVGWKLRLSTGWRFPQS